MNINYKSTTKVLKTYSFLVIVLVSISTHIISINKPPMSAFAWAHSDHYALAIGFVKNNFDFFHPRSYALNHQYPGIIENPSPLGITSVDFPLLHYIVAIGFKLFNSFNPTIYRLVVLLTSMLALYFFHKSIVETKGRFFALFVCLFIVLQPCYNFYQDNFHVTTTAFNIFLIGLGLLVKCTLKKKDKHLGVIALFTLAALLRFIFIIPLLALLCVKVLNRIIKKGPKSFVNELIGIFIVLLYFMYNKYLANKYGSIFISQPLYPHSFEEVIFYLHKMVQSYIRVVLPPLHIIGLIIILFFTRKTNEKSLNITLIVFNVFLLLGSLIFCGLMLINVGIHEYYSISVFLPSIITFFCCLELNKMHLQKIKYRILFILLFIGAFGFVIRSQTKRYNPIFSNTLNGGEDAIIKCFTMNKCFLDTIIEPTAKVLVICESGWNIPLVGWGRSAHRIGGNLEKNFIQIFNKKYDYIVVYNKSLCNEQFIKYKNLIRANKLITSNEDLSIYTQRKSCE